MVFIENALCFQVVFIPTPTFAGYISFTQYEWENRKSYNSQFPIILMILKTFSASFFWITVWRASKEQSNFFWNKFKFEAFTIDFKGNKWLLWSRCLELDKKIRPEVARTRTIKTSCELPAGAGKFPPVTRLNRRQSLPFYLRISLPAGFADNIARASFTV